MNWGSTWEFTDYAEVNWWNLYVAVAKVGGTQSKGVNPLLRVAKPQSDSLELPDLVTTEQSSISTQSKPLHVRDKGELVYATESFSGQQVDMRNADPRWQRERRELLVPVLDDRLLVAHQKILRDEEIEFFLLVVATEGDTREHI